MSPLNEAICTTTYLKTKMLWLGQENTIQKTIIWPWGQRSRSHKGHNGTWHCLMVMYPHTKYWHLERQKCYGPDKKILFKKQLFDLEVKGQGPTKVIMVCDTALWSCTHIPNKYYLKNNYLTSRSNNCFFK